MPGCRYGDGSQMSEINPLFAGIDAGGTTFKCALADSDGHVVARERFPTSEPLDTIAACVRFFQSKALEFNAEIKALGIAAFGPLNVDPHSPEYGTILETPKPLWSGTNLCAEFHAALGVPVHVDTDVNGALLAEVYSGAAKDCETAVYVTIGTGIGAGILTNGNLIAKPGHPEFGHIPVRRHQEDAYPGRCPFHGDCLEGMASAVAFTDRFGAPQNLAADHRGWPILASYLAQACWVLTLSFRPERILLGGGLMLAPHLLVLVRDHFLIEAAGYIGIGQREAEAMIKRPLHGDDAGVLGGLYLARNGVGK